MRSILNSKTIPAPRTYEELESVHSLAMDQLRYHEARSARSQKLFKRSRTLAECLSIACAFLAAMNVTGPTLVLLTGLIALLMRLDTSNRWQENWTNSRQTADNLRVEITLYNDRKGAYSASDYEDVFAERVFELIKQEGSLWTSAQRAQQVAQSQSPQPVG